MACFRAAPGMSDRREREGDRRGGPARTAGGSPSLAHEHDGNIASAHIDIERPRREDPDPEPRRHGPLDSLVAPKLHLVAGTNPDARMQPRTASRVADPGSLSTKVSVARSFRCRSVARRWGCRPRRRARAGPRRPAGDKGWVVFPPTNDAEPQGSVVNTLQNMLAVAKANLQLHRWVGTAKATQHLG